MFFCRNVWRCMRHNNGCGLLLYQGAEFQDGAHLWCYSICNPHASPHAAHMQPTCSPHAAQGICIFCFTYSSLYCHVFLYLINISVLLQHENQGTCRLVTVCIYKVQHFHPSCLSLRGAWANPTWQWVRVGVHPGHQRIAGRTSTDKQSFILTVTPKDNLESPINQLQSACLWTVGGSSTQKDPGWTRILARNLNLHAAGQLYCQPNSCNYNINIKASSHNVYKIYL